MRSRAIVTERAAAAECSGITRMALTEGWSTRAPRASSRRTAGS